MSDETPKKNLLRVLAPNEKQDPYCAFSDDSFRYRAMRNREIRLGVVSVALAVCTLFGHFLKL